MSESMHVREGIYVSVKARICYLSRIMQILFTRASGHVG